MQSNRTKLIFGLFGVVLLALIFYCCREHKRELQHRSIARYINSGQMFKTLAELGWAPNRIQDFSVSMDDRGIQIQVDARSKQEFNRLVLIAARTDRPTVEHVNIRFQENVSSRR